MLRGDFQTLGRHATALVVSYGWSDELSTVLTGMLSPVDGSGIGSGALTWNHSDAVSVVASAFVPWGARPAAMTLGSEYGLSSISGFLQLRVYD